MISLTCDQMVEVAIRCCLGMDSDRESLAAWRMWAERWLSGEDRTASAAQAAARDVFAHVTDDASTDVFRVGLDAANAARLLAARSVVSQSLAYFYAVSAVNRAGLYDCVSPSAPAGAYAACAKPQLDVAAIVRQVWGKENP